RHRAEAAVEFPVGAGFHLLGAHQQQLFLLQGEEVGALPHRAVFPAAAVQGGAVGPAAGVGAFVQQDAALIVGVPGGQHTVVPPVLVPDLGVAEIHRAAALVQQVSPVDRVGGFLYEVGVVPHGQVLSLV